MQIKSYDTIIAKLRNSKEPLSIERQKKLADLLEQFRTLHDSVLWDKSIVRVVKGSDTKIYVNSQESEKQKTLDELKNYQNPEPLPWEK